MSTTGLSILGYYIHLARPIPLECATPLQYGYKISNYMGDAGMPSSLHESIRSPVLLNLEALRSAS